MQFCILVEIRNQIFYVHPAKLEQLRNGFLDDVIRAGGSRCHPDLDLPLGQPALGNLLFLRMLVVVLDLIRRNHLGAVSNKVGR